MAGNNGITRLHVGDTSQKSQKRIEVKQSISRRRATSRERVRLGLALGFATLISGFLIGTGYVLVGIPFSYFVGSGFRWWPDVEPSVINALFAAAFAVVVGGTPAAVVSFLALASDYDPRKRSFWLSAVSGPAMVAIFSIVPLVVTAPIYLIPFFALAAFVIGGTTFLVAATLAARRVLDLDDAGT
jgi:hypothetical protein